jgi:hypothetical protein
MDRESWLAEPDPLELLLKVERHLQPHQFCRLAVACCRQLGQWMVDPRSQRAVESAEAWLEGRMSAQTLTIAFDDAFLAWCDHTHERDREKVSHASQMASFAARPSLSVEKPSRFRDMVGRLCQNQDFRQFLLAALRDVLSGPARLPTLTPACLAWGDRAVIRLARDIYDEQAFDHMPMLADALEDASCGDKDILRHCRTEGPHFRGCWVLELILEWKPGGSCPPA